MAVSTINRAIAVEEEVSELPGVALDEGHEIEGGGVDDLGRHRMDDHR